jgi:hypothetical protein
MKSPIIKASVLSPHFWFIGLFFSILCVLVLNFSVAPAAAQERGKVQELNDKVEMVEQIDDVLDWVYPLIYVVLLIVLIIWFFIV